MLSTAPVSTLLLSPAQAAAEGFIDPALARRFSNLMERPAASAINASDADWKNKLDEIGKEMNKGFVSLPQLRVELNRIVAAPNDMLLKSFQLADLNMRMAQSANQLHLAGALATGFVEIFGSLMKQHQ